MSISIIVSSSGVSKTFTYGHIFSNLFIYIEKKIDRSKKSILSMHFDLTAQSFPSVCHILIFGLSIVFQNEIKIIGQPEIDNRSFPSSNLIRPSSQCNVNKTIVTSRMYHHRYSSPGTNRSPSELLRRGAAAVFSLGEDFRVSLGGALMG